MPIEYKKILPPAVQVFIVPIVLLIILGILSGLAIRIGFGRIGQQRQDVAVARQNENTLSQKEGVLRSNQGTIPSFVNTVAASLPEKSPALSMTSQLRNLALANGIILENIKIGSAVPSGSLSEVDITFGLEGTPQQVVSYLNSIKNLAPVSTIEKAKINQSALGTRADVTVRVYYSPFPEKLPSLTEAVKELNEDERNTLNRLSALSLPAFTDLQPQPAGTRDNPFD